MLSRTSHLVRWLTLVGALAAFGWIGLQQLQSVRPPDLSGTYDIGTLTPLERASIHGGKLSLSAEEARRAGLGGGKPVDGDWFEDQVGERPDDPLVIDGKIRSSIITSPANGRLPPLTDAGDRKFRKNLERVRQNPSVVWWLSSASGPFDGPEDRPLEERCLLGMAGSAGPPALPVMHNNLKRIVQTDAYVVIHNEMIHDARIVRMNGTHAPSTVRSWLGDSIGHWEGKTLVVDTTNFRDDTGLRMAGRDLHVVERFTRVDSHALLYQFTVTDPAWQEPWSGEYLWRSTEAQLYEYACHEGNYSLGAILRGARLLEAEAREGGREGDDAPPPGSGRSEEPGSGGSSETGI